MKIFNQNLLGELMEFNPLDNQLRARIIATKCRRQGHLELADRIHKKYLSKVRHQSDMAMAFGITMLALSNKKS